MDAIGLYTLMFTKSDTEILEALNNYNYTTQSINLVCPVMPLHQAILTRRTQLVEILLSRRDGPIDLPDNYNGLHPLHCISEVPTSIVALSILKENFPVKHSYTINILENYITTSVYIEIIKEIIVKGTTHFTDSDILALDKKIKSDELKIAKMLIDNGCSVNALDNYKFTPLHKAVFNEMWEMINLLMDNGANASLKSIKGDTALEYFMKTNRRHFLKPLCRGTSLEYFIKTNRQSFLKSICRDASLEYFTKTKRELKVIKKLISCYNRYKYIEVMKPSDTVNYEFNVLKYLLDSGVIDVNSVDGYKKTPLHYIMETKNYNIISQLVSKGADINAKDIRDETPLHKAVMLGASMRVIKTCIKLGANINALNSLDRTPLYYAINTRCNISIIKLLLDNGADINIKDKYGTSFLHRASMVESNKVYKIIDMLISRGADINAINIYGVTPLHKAAMICNMPRLMKILIKHGSNVNSVDVHGRTPLHEVSGNGSRYKMIDILIENGADVNARDNNGNTPIYNSIYYESSLKAFIDNGASVNIVNNTGVSILQKLSEIYYYDDRYVYTAKILIPKIVLESHIPNRHSNKIGLERNMQKIDSNSDLKIFKDKCELEFNIIKSLKIGNNHTLDMLFRSNNVILMNSLINKLDTVKINLSSFPIYYYYLHKRIENIKKRYTLLKASINKMNSILKNSYWSLLPTEIKYSILCYLGNNDLSNVTESISSK